MPSVSVITKIYPFGSVFILNKNLSPLPPHKLSAIFAMIEIENKLHIVDDKNY